MWLGLRLFTCVHCCDVVLQQCTLSVGAGALVDRPGALVDRPGALVDRPGALVDRANALVDRANALVDRAGALVDRANALVDRANALVDRAGALVDRAGALVDKSESQSCSCHCSVRRVCTHCERLPQGVHCKACLVIELLQNTFE